MQEARGKRQCHGLQRHGAVVPIMLMLNNISVKSIILPIVTVLSGAKKKRLSFHPQANKMYYHSSRRNL